MTNENKDMISDILNLNTSTHELRTRSRSVQACACVSERRERRTSGLVETPGVISGSHFRSINGVFRCTDEAEEGV